MAPIPAAPGIYRITNTVSGKFYIGSSNNLRHRWSTHLSDLRRGVHANPMLAAAWRKYGAVALVFQVVELCDASELLVREQWHLDAHAPVYNVLAKAGSSAGRVASEATRAKMSTANKGKIIPPEVRAKISASLLGRKIPRDVVQRRAEKMRGRRGHSHGPEAIAKIMAARARQRVMHTAETRAKIASAHIGLRHSDETKRKVSENRKGKGLGPCDPEKAAAIARAKAVFSDAQIREIRCACAAGEKHADVGARMGCSKAAIGYIARRKSYTWVQD